MLSAMGTTGDVCPSFLPHLTSYNHSRRQHANGRRSLAKRIRIGGRRGHALQSAARYVGRDPERAARAASRRGEHRIHIDI
jgi:hypothetical protein